MYFENVSTQISILMQDNLIGILFYGLLAKFPTILDGFPLVPQVITWRWLVGGGREPWKTHAVYINDQLVLEMAQKVVKSVDIVISLQGHVRSYSPVAFV